MPFSSSLSIPPISPVTGTEVQGISHELLPSFPASNRTQEESHNEIDTEEFTIQCLHQLRTDSFVSPDSPELLTLNELFAPFTSGKLFLVSPISGNTRLTNEVAVSSCNLTSQLCPSKMSSLKQVNVSESRVEEGALIKNNVAENGYDTEKQTITEGLSPLTTKRVRFVSPLPLKDYRSTTNGLSRTSKHIRFVSPLPVNCSSISDDDSSLINLVGPLSTATSTSSLRKTVKLKRRETIKTRMENKRKLFKKNQKKQLVGKLGPSVISKDGVHRARGLKKRKPTKHEGKQHQKGTLNLRKSLGNKKTQDYCPGGSATAAADVAASDLECLSLVREVFLAKVEKSLDEVMTEYFDGRPKQLESGQTEPKGNNQLRLAVRNHIRNLMFPNISKYSYGQIPWTRFGLWLYSYKKRFINWDKNIPFAGISSVLVSYFQLMQLEKLLMIDLVDWTEDEIQFGNTEVPLVVDPTGHVLVKVGDLPRLYPNGTSFWGFNYKQPVFIDDQERIGSRYEAQSSTTTSRSSSARSSSSSSSASSSTTVISRNKRKRRTRLPKKPKRIMVTYSDEDSDSDPESEEDYETDEIGES